MALAILALATFSLKRTFDANAEIKVLEAKLIHQDEEHDKAIENLEKENEVQQSHARQITKHWRLHRWTYEQVTILRQKQDLPLAPWPNLNPDLPE